MNSLSVLNDNLVKNNYAFPLLQDYIQPIGQNHCKVMSVSDLEAAHNTLTLASVPQKYCGITPWHRSPTYVYMRMGMVLSASPII